MAVNTAAQQQLLDLINFDNKTTFTFDEVSLSLPSPVEANDRNTYVLMTAKPSARFVGQRDVYYNRIALTKLGYVGVVSDAPITPAELLAMISAEKRIDLLPEEFDTIILPVLEIGEEGIIKLRSKEQAIKWYGEIDVNISFGLPDNINLFHEFLHVTLPAADYLGT